MRRPKISFALLPEPGHINPMIGVMQYLQQSGHDVTALCCEDISEQMQKALIPFSQSALKPSRQPKLSPKQLIELVRDENQQKNLIQHFFLHETEAKQSQYQKAYIKIRPQLVVADSMNYPAILAANANDIPWVSLSSSLSMVVPQNVESAVLRIVEDLAPLRKNLFAKNGFPHANFYASDCLSPLLNITFAHKEFIEFDKNDVHLVGPSFPLHLRGDEVIARPLPSDKKIVYVSFGSQVSHLPHLFEKILCSREDCHFVFSLGDLVDEHRWQGQNNLHAYRYAPQLELLKRADLFITHGGANSVAEGLASGVPLWVSAICNDQFHQAFFVEKSGVGIAADLEQLSSAEIGERIGKILGDQGLKARVAQLARAYQKNGAAQAANLIAGFSV